MQLERGKLKKGTQGGVLAREEGWRKAVHQSCCEKPEGPNLLVLDEDDLNHSSTRAGPTIRIRNGTRVLGLRDWGRMYNLDGGL